VSEREREREKRDRGRERETLRQSDRQTTTITDRHYERQIDRQTL
jgi:hypothetical protein